MRDTLLDADVIFHAAERHPTRIDAWSCEGTVCLAHTVRLDYRFSVAGETLLKWGFNNTQADAAVVLARCGVQLIATYFEGLHPKSGTEVMIDATTPATCHLSAREYDEIAQRLRRGEPFQVPVRRRSHAAQATSQAKHPGRSTQGS